VTSDRGHLLRLLGVGFGVAIAVGEAIGSGILRSPSLIASTLPDSGIIIALWVLGALHALLGANILAEMGTALPFEGGQPVYARRAFGDIGGLIVGWTLYVSHLAGTASASVVFADFLGGLWPVAANHTIFVALTVQCLLYGLNAIGLREGRLVQVATSIVKALLLASFVGAALWLGTHESARVVSSIPAAPAGFLVYIGAYQLILGAYAGWAAPVAFAEENTTPARTIPRALLLGIVITGGLYILINAALLFALGTSGTAAAKIPFITVLDNVAGKWASLVFVIGAMVTVTSSANANIMIGPRILFALSRDRLLPSAFQIVNTGGSPYVGIVLTALGSLALAATGSFRLVFGLIGTLNSASGLITDLSWFALRRREPDLPRPFRAILAPWLPALLVLIDAGLLVLFAASDRRGAIVAATLCLLCIPFALIARRARLRTA
jgi:APA family basic amino acid/polyamine antiporter